MCGFELCFVFYSIVMIVEVELRVDLFQYIFVFFLNVFFNGFC